MTLQKANLVYFSATGTTAKIVSAIESGLGVKEKKTHNLIKSDQKPVSIPNDEIAIFGSPVFSGRVPDVARKAFEKIKGNSTPAIIVCVYGNRDFEDALLELKEIVEANGFYVLSAGAFIAQHSIFPEVAQGRPDKSDFNVAKEFGVNSIKAITTATENIPLMIKGNHPYRAVSPIPLNPKTDNKCISCELCVKQCPTQAIDLQNPKKIDKRKCISCAHCISICPTHSKRFGGLLYWLISKSFLKKNSRRKEPYLVYR